GAGRGRDQTAGSLRGRRASRTHDDTGDTLFSELEHEGCNEVDWRQASCSGLCGRVRAQRGEVPGAACTGSDEVVALGGVVTKTAPEFGDLSRSMRGLSNPGSEFSNPSSQFSGFSFQIV